MLFSPLILVIRDNKNRVWIQVNNLIYRTNEMHKGFLVLYVLKNLKLKYDHSRTVTIR